MDICNRDTYATTFDYGITITLPMPTRATQHHYARSELQEGVIEVVFQYPLSS